MEKERRTWKLHKGSIDNLPAIERRNKKNEHAKKVVSKQKMRVNQVLSKYKQDSLYRKSK